MHSSRMRTGRSVTVCCSLLPDGGGGVLPARSRGGGVCLVGAVLPARSQGWGGGSPCQVPGGGGVLPARSWGVSAWSRGGSPCQVLGGGALPARSRGGSPCWGGVLPARSRGEGGLPVQGGWGLPGDPPVNRITHTCKNITLATTSLRPVNMASAFCMRDTTGTNCGHSAYCR